MGAPEPPLPQGCRHAARQWNPMAAALSVPRFRTGRTTVATGRDPASPAVQDAIVTCNVLIAAAAITERVRPRIYTLCKKYVTNSMPAERRRPRKVYGPGMIGRVPPRRPPSGPHPTPAQAEQRQHLIPVRELSPEKTIW